MYTYSSFTKTLIAVALQSKGVLYKNSASFSDGNSSESIDPTTVIYYYQVCESSNSISCLKFHIEKKMLRYNKFG